MKKYILFCLVSIWSLTTLAINVTSNLNPYAYNLKHSISGDYITFSYCLNANVESVDIVVLNGEKEVKRYSLTDDYLKKTESNNTVDPYQTASAAHKYQVPTAQLQAGVKLTWRVEVKGAGRTQVEVYGTNGTAKTYKFYRPSSVDIVKDPTSYNYGKVLVVEGNDAARNTATGTYHSSKMTKTKGTAVGNNDPQGAGVYVFNPDLTPRENTSGTYVFNGKDDARFQGAIYGPHRVRVSDDGRIFVASMHTDGNILWEIPATFGEWKTVMGKGVGGAKWVGNTTSGDGVDTEYRLNTSGGTFFAAPVAGLDVRGSGENLQLLMLCCTEKAFGMGQNGYHTYEYNLGTASTWSSKPSKDFYTHSYIFVLPQYSQVQYDKDGAIWCSSYLDDYKETSPALVHIPRTVSAIRTDDYRDYTSDPIRKAAFRFNNTYDKTIIAKWNESASRVEGHIYRVGKDASGKPTINGTGEPQIDMSAVGGYINDFVWDNANNIYAVGQNNKGEGSDGRLALYCLPYSAEDVFTTSGPESFTIAATVQDPSGEGVVTASKYEFRGLWCATVTNIDWPSTGAQGNIAKQKQELIDILDALQAGNINAVCLQVRSLSDALYESSYEPWAACLTGERGDDPEYDPLAFAIEETHKRGMELHAWVNPFRVTSEKLTTGSTPYQALPETDKLYTANTALKGKIVEYSITNSEGKLQKGQILDPGYPEVREHIVKVLMEIVTKYDIDGLLMDDYFYPSVDADTKNTFDSGSQALYFTPNQNTIEDFNENRSKLDDWRRGNVDKVIEALSNQMRAVKPWVRFGMGPFGIWSSGEKDVIYTKYGIEKPDGITGANYYGDRGCNTVEWIKNGWVDYVNPQLYWPSSTSPKDYRRGQDYHILYNWWSDVCTTLSTALPGNQQVQFYPSHAVDRVYNPTYNWGVDEMRTQVSHTRDVLTNGYSGSVYYSARYYLNLNNWINTKHDLTITSTMCQELRASHYQTKALVPPMSWKSNTQLAAPTQLRLDGNTLSWQHSTGAARYTVYVYPKNVNMYTAISEVRYLQQVVYGNSIALAGFDPATHNVAVRSYDRYGVEYEATEYAPEIIWVLNGGEVGTREIVCTDVPTSDALWKTFVENYDNKFGTNIGLTSSSGTRTPTNFLYVGKNTHTKDVRELINDTNYDWGWLKTYIETVSGTFSLDSEVKWRYSLAAFFESNAGNSSYNVSFADKGVNSTGWHNAYKASHTTQEPIVLPNFWDEDEEFKLPIASEMSHSKGYTLAGWTDASGNPIIEINKGYAGIIYAQWTNASNTLVKWYLNGGVYTGKTTLPLEIEHDYVLPSATQMHKEGQKFVGWYGDANFTGDAKQTVAAGYAGSLYAKWSPAEHVTWHINTSVEMGNEDLWQQFMTEYNEYYYSGLPATQQRGRTAIDNLKTFISVTGSATDKRVANFMTDLNSPMRWLGNYITNAVKEYVISSGSPTEMDPNEALWQLFKKDAGITTYTKSLAESAWADFAGSNGLPQNNTGVERIKKVFSNSRWSWLQNYMEVHDTDANANNQLTIKATEVSWNSNDSENTTAANKQLQNWRRALASFFLTPTSVAYPYIQCFVDAGAYSVWGTSDLYKNSDIKAEVDALIESLDPDHIHIELESDWSYLLDAFFNHKTADAKCGFPVDFTLVGLPKPNGDADAGWYNAWFAANCPQYMLNGDHVSQIARDGYLLGGWYYGDETGYIHTAAMRVDGTFSTDIEDKYQNHLWARWLKLHLYEGYVDADPYALDANGNRKQGKVNNNEELASCGFDGYKRGYKMDVDRKLVGGQYNTMVLPFAINGQGSYKDVNNDSVWDNLDTGKPGKEYYLSRVLDAERNMLLDPATTSILVYDGCEILTENGEQIIEFIFHEYAQSDECEDLVAHKPFLIKPENDITTTMRFDWEASFASFENNGIPAMLDDDAEPVFQAALAPTTLLANHATESHLMLVTNNRLAQVNSDSEMLGLRGYFRVPKAGTQAINSRIRVVEEGTDVENHPTTGAVVVRKVLRNGHIYILRDGKTYSITGARVE